MLWCQGFDFKILREGKLSTDYVSLILVESGDGYMGVHYNILSTSVFLFKKFIFFNFCLVTQPEQISGLILSPVPHRSLAVYCWVPQLLHDQWGLPGSLCAHYEDCRRISQGNKEKLLQLKCKCYGIFIILAHYWQTKCQVHPSCRLGWHNKIPHTGWLKQQKFIFSKFWRLEVQIKAPDNSVPGKSALPGLQTATFSIRALVAFPLSVRGWGGGWRERERWGEGGRKVSLFFFLWSHQSYWIRVHPSWLHLTLITS